jgi:hypothetical protein
MQTPIQGLIISNSHYWKIDGILSSGFIGKGKFNYSKSGLDKGLIINSADSLIILYRANTKEDWQFVNYTRTGNSVSGYISTDSIRKGEYTFAIWDWDYYNIINKSNTLQNKLLSIFPNPSSDSFTIVFNYKTKGLLRIMNSSGKIIESYEVKQGQTQMIWNPGNQKSGIYIIEFNNNNIIERNKVIYTK